jgi:hypothetical protein
MVQIDHTPFKSMDLFPLFKNYHPLEKGGKLQMADAEGDLCHLFKKLFDMESVGRSGVKASGR